jgi:hypothetical protein
MRKVAKRPARREPPRILKGWKAIGEYLGVGASEAERWAAKRGMPVAKVGRGVVANEQELREWNAKQSHMPGPAIVLNREADIAEALRESISSVRRGKRKQ